MLMQSFRRGNAITPNFRPERDGYFSIDPAEGVTCMTGRLYEFLSVWSLVIFIIKYSRRRKIISLEGYSTTSIPRSPLVNSTDDINR